MGLICSRRCCGLPAGLPPGPGRVAPVCVVRFARLVLGLLLLIASPCGAQTPPQTLLQSARARVQVRAVDDAALVQLQYTVTSASPAAPIRVRAIPFFGLEASDVVVRINGTPARLELRTVQRGVFAAEIVPAAPLPSDRSVDIELHYSVADAVVRVGERLDVRTPVLFVDGAPAASGDDFFGAELLAPRGVTVTESFPTVRRVHRSEADGERYAISLQVVPSLLRWRATQGPPPWLSFEAAVDGALLILMGALALLGVRALTGKPR